MIILGECLWFHGYFHQTVAFLYRQSLELYLKLLIRMSNDILALLGKNIRRDAKGHRLGPLWEHVKALATEIDPIPAEVAPAVDAVIREFETMDRTSEAFRYPLSLQEQPLLPPEVRIINLAELQDTMGRIANFFSCATSHYGTILDQMENDPTA